MSEEDFDNGILPIHLPCVGQITPKCTCIHALDDYETYVMDDGRIGVRPLWYDVNHRLPKLAKGYQYSDDVLCFIRSNGMSIHPNFPNTFLKDETYISIEKIIRWTDNHKPCFFADRFYGKVLYWMPLPKPPEAKDG